jgi:Transposase, Mutator family
VHRARNVLAKVPKNAQAQVKADYWAIFDVPDKIEPGLDAVGYVQKRIDSFEKRWRDSYPAAVRCLLDDRDSLTVYLRFPHSVEELFEPMRRVARQHGAGDLELYRKEWVVAADHGAEQCLALGDHLLLQISRVQPALGGILGQRHRRVDHVAPSGHVRHRVSSLDLGGSTASASMTANSFSRASAIMLAALWVTLRSTVSRRATVAACSGVSDGLRPL